MRLADYLDKGASLGLDRPCLTTDGVSASYGETVTLSHRIAAALIGCGVRPGETVAILSGNDPVAFTGVFGISRAGAVWCPVNPRNEAGENAELLSLVDCRVLVYAEAYAPLVAEVVPRVATLRTVVSLADEAGVSGALGWRTFLDRGESGEVDVDPLDDVALIVGTGGTTGRPKGVVLSERNVETMTALTLMSYPFSERLVYLALAPLTHAAGVLCFPVLSRGGEVVVMRAPDVGGFLDRIEQHRVTHTFLPPTLVYMLLDHPSLPSRDLSSLECLWYGAAPMSVSRLQEALGRGWPMAQLFGQSEAPMMISTMSPAEHLLPDGSPATARLASAGRPSPLVHVAILDDDGRVQPAGERGEICVRSSLVMRGYLKDPEATAEVGRFGWHHTGDIGYLDDDGYLFVVDRAKDMIISGGFNVYSAEVEQAVMATSDVQDCAVVGLPDEKWGERVVAVVQPRPGAHCDPETIRQAVRTRIGAVKAPKEVLVWDDLPRSKVGKVLKGEVRSLLAPVATGSPEGEGTERG